MFERQTDWDVLCILDGCRYDTFQKVNMLPGTLQARISRGSCTPEWAQAEIPQTANNIVYVSANPYVSEYYFAEEWQRSQPFYHLEEIWDTGWDDTLKTVPPRKVLAAGAQLLKKHPTKKIVLHFMQPHHPFIGKRGIREKTGWESSRQTVLGQPESRYGENVYDLLQHGKTTQAEVISAYQDNLALVLSKIRTFLKQHITDQRVVITSDHGNCFGEYGLYAHPEATYIRELIQVPWFTVENEAGSKKPVVSS